MPRHADDLDLDVDLQGGVVPISKAASSLASLIKRGQQRRQPIVVTQKGYPTGVILSIELYTALRERAGLAEGAAPPQGAEVVPEPESAEPEPAAAEPEPPPARKGRGGRKAKAAQ